MALPSYKEILELIKTGATIEAQEKIMELRQAALALQEENIELRNQVIALQEQVKSLSAADGEPCPSCRQRSWVVAKSEPDPTFGDLGAIKRTYNCSSCGFTETKLITP